MAKCNKCLRGAKLGVTGVNPSNTLKMDMGGAVLYVMPKVDGKIEVILNSQNLCEGDYAFANWDGEEWKISTDNPINTPKR